jgi:transcription-repair coupling factor (superfamily II helicase)
MENQLLRITRFLNAILKFNIKTAIQNKYHFKRIDNVVRWRLCNIDHGIGRFGGLQKIQVENKTQEAIKLVYADNDIVRSIHSLHKISKYTGKDGTPKIYKLGSNAWKVLKQKNEGRVKILHSISAVCQRRLDKGFSFP